MKMITRIRNLKNGERYRYAAEGHCIAGDKTFGLTGPCASTILQLSNLNTAEEQFDFVCFALLWENFNHISRHIYDGETPALTRFKRLQEQFTTNPWYAHAKYVVPTDTLRYADELFDTEKDLRLDTAKKIFDDISECEYIMYGYPLKRDRKINDDLLDCLLKLDPLTFEIVVAELLKTMGYGDYALTNKAVDGGVDIIFSEDPLGLHKVYVQVKRYARRNQVTKREMQNFIGALDILREGKGIFVTTSRYYREVYEVQAGTQKNIVLVDGEKLCEMMIEYGLGVTGAADMQHVDMAYFNVVIGLTQKRLLSPIGRSGVWADENTDSSAYVHILDSDLVPPSYLFE